MLVPLCTIRKKNGVSERVKSLVGHAVKREEGVAAEIHVKSYLFALETLGHIKGILEKCTPTVIAPTVAHINFFPPVIKEFIIVNTFIDALPHFPRGNGLDIGVNSFFKIFDFECRNIVKGENTPLFALCGVTPIINVGVHCVKGCHSVNIFNFSQTYRPFSNRKPWRKQAAVFDFIFLSVYHYM